MSKIIRLDDRSTVTVEKLPIGKYAELLKALQELPKKFSDIENLTTDKIVEMLPKLVGDCLPDVLKIIEIATPLNAEQIAKLGLAETIDLLVAIFEVNNFARVFETLKKVMAHQNQLPMKQ